MKNLIIITLLSFLSISANAFNNENPLILIGASLANGDVPYNEGLESPLFGFSTNSGSYLSLGEALVQKKEFVINVAESGATSFDRVSCFIGIGCISGHWNGYDIQLQRALGRVFNPFTGGFNAKYVIILNPNDCLHSNAFGIPQEDTVQCTTADFIAMRDRLIAVGQQAINLGLIPIYDEYIDFNALDFDALLAFGLLWVIDEVGYNEMKAIQAQIKNLLPGSLQVDIWDGFVDLGDGSHPDETTSKNAAIRILQAIKDFEMQ